MEPYEKIKYKQLEDFVKEFRKVSESRRLDDIVKKKNFVLIRHHVDQMMDILSREGELQKKQIGADSVELFDSEEDTSED